MDLITLALAKKFATSVSAGYSSVSVEGNIIHFTLNDGQTVDMVIPTPADGTSVEYLNIDANGNLLCYLSNGDVINAGGVPMMKGEPGFSPVAEINQEGGITTISITDEEKTSNVTIDMRNYVSAKADGFNITWDGDTTGLTSSNPAQYYKVSDKILTVDDLVGANVSAVFQGTEETGIITEDGINERYNYILANSDMSAGGTVISVYALPAGGGGVNFYETGTYFTSLKATLGMDIYTSSLTKGDSSIQTIEGNKDFTGNVTIQGNSLATQANLDTVEAIAKGANQAITFNNYKSMIDTINTLETNKLNIGQNLMIVTLNVPDLWVSAIEETKVAYNYTDDKAFTSDLVSNGFVQVGYYKVSALETQKVDLTDYVKNTDYATSSKAGLLRPGNGLFMSGSTGAVLIAKASNAQIDAKTDSYYPIVPANLDYAVKSVVGGHVAVTQQEYDDMVAAGTIDENTFYYFKGE